MMNARLEGKTTSNQSVVNLINCLLGAGVLGFPYCFKSCGLVLASCIMLVSLLACRFSYSLLLYCSQLSSKRTYEELTEQALGPIGKKTVEICTAALNLGCMVAYLNILADVLSSVAGTIIPPGAEPSRSVYLAGVTLFGAFPVAMIVRDHHVVQAFSAASVGFILIFTLIILILAASPAAHPTSLSTTKLWEQDGLLVAFPVMAYCFTAHPYYLGIYQNLQQPTHKRMLWVTDLALLFAAGVYFLVGMSGYLMFRSRTAGDLLRNFGAASVGGARGSYERAVKLFYGLSILGSVPLVILPFYNIVLPLLGFDKDPEYDGSKTSPTLSGSSTTSDKAHQSDTEEDADTEEEGSKRPRSSLDGLDPRVSQVKSDEAFAQPLLHATIALVILGAAMASAIWIPNVEFIFGLTGATASVLIAYILPSLTFIRLLDNSSSSASVSVESPSPHHSNHHGRGSLSSSHHHPANSTSSSVWAWRRRLAVCLLLFGIISGITCTDAILSAVREEAVVVKIAQKLAQEGAVIAETSRTQQLAKEAVVTVSAVTAAGKQLGAAQANASGTLGKLQEAAQQLEAISGSESNSSTSHDHGDTSKGGGGGILGGIGDMIKEHKAQQQETKVLRNVTWVISSVIDEISSTYQSVDKVILHLDDAIAKLKTEALKQANDTAAATAKASSGTDRVSSLAAELGKALGGYSIDPSNFASSSSGLKALEQLRSNAKATLSALNQTLNVLQRVSRDVSKAKEDHHSGSSQMKDVATQAMRAALNATATSALAMNLTRQALQKSAHKETEELISVLNRVTNDLQKAQGSRAKASASPPPPPPPPLYNSSSVATNATTVSSLPSAAAQSPPPPSSSPPPVATNATVKVDGGKTSKGEELKKAIEGLAAATNSSTSSEAAQKQQQEKQQAPGGDEHAQGSKHNPPPPPVAPEDSLEELNEKELDAAQVAIDEAASLTKTDKEEAIKKIGDSLGQIGSTKVQERVTELVKELKDAKDVSKANAEPEVVAVAVSSDSSAASLLKKDGKASGDEELNVTAVVEKSLTLDKESKEVKSKADEDVEKIRGPIVAVKSDGKLVQEEEGAVVASGEGSKASSGLARKLGLGAS